MPLNKPVLFHSVGTNLCALFMLLEKLEPQSTKLKIVKALVIHGSNWGKMCWQRQLCKLEVNIYLKKKTA